MMDLKTIRHLSSEAARKAKRSKAKLFIVDTREAAAEPRFPNFGDYRPAGWALVDTLFVDKTGWGAEDEPAMTQAAFIAWIRQQFAAGKVYGYAMIQEGQFQAYVGVFERKAARKPARKAKP